MPSRGTIHINQPLSMVAGGYKNAEHIWSKVMPAIPVDKEKDSYYEFGNEFLRYQGKKRANGTEANRVNSYSASEKTYECKEHSYWDIVTERDRSLADPVINPDVRVTNNVTKIIDLDIEVDTAAQVFNASNFSGMTSAPSANWKADTVGSQPIEDFKTAIRAVQKKVGVKPNIAVIGAEVLDQLEVHPELLDYYKYVGKAPLSIDLIAKALTIDQLVVGESIYITSKQGQSTVTTDYIWGKNCAILYVPSIPAIEEPSWGYTFLHKLFGGLTARVKKWRAEELDGDKIEVGRSYDTKVTGQSAGYLWTAVIP